MIAFDLQIYSPKAIQEAIREYHELARIDVVKECGQWICIIKDTVLDFEQTCQEFSNYVLGLTVIIGDNYS